MIAAVASTAGVGLRAYAQTTPTTNNAPLPTPNQVIAREIVRLNGILTSPDATTSADQREQAAERLAALNRPEGNASLLDAIRRSSGPGVAEARVAVATALASGRAAPDASYLDPLRALLAADPVVAAPALARYATTPQANDALGVLSDVARDSHVGTRGRVVTVDALGAFARRPVAETLIDLLNRPDENDDVRFAAADALGNMTGLTDNGRDAAKWNAWWQSAIKPNGQWAFDEPLASRVSVLDHKADELTMRVEALLKSTYNQTFADFATAPEDRKPELAKRMEALLLGWLRDTQPVFRQSAVDIAYDQAQYGRRMTRDVSEQLGSMITDASPDVRRRVVITLRNVSSGDPNVTAALLAQLTVEPEDDVRIQIIGALGASRDLRAVDVLLALLDDPGQRIRVAAASTLGRSDLKDVLRADAATRRLVSKRLQAKLAQLASTNAPGSSELRAAYLDAAAPLGDPAFRRTFAEALDQGDSRNADERVRISAARGLGNLTNPEDRDYAAQRLVDAMADDRSYNVRLNAVLGLRNVGTFDRVSDALILRMTPGRGSNFDPSVRNAAWDVLLDLAKASGVSAASVRQLAELPIIKEDPAKRVVALELVVRKLLATPKIDARAEQELANVHQNIGDCYVISKRWNDAVAHYSAALNYWQTNPAAPQSTLSSLSEKVERCYLKGRNYPGAVQFAGQRVEKGAPDEEATMGHLINDELYALQEAKNFQDASKLVDEAINKMKPPFSQDIAQQLQRTRIDIQKRASQGSHEFDPLAPLDLV